MYDSFRAPPTSIFRVSSYDGNLLQDIFVDTKLSRDGVAYILVHHQPVQYKSVQR